MSKLKILSLFSGIGGFEVGLSLSNLAEYAEVTQFVEINPFCQHVLATRFPGVPIAGDLRKFNPVAGQFDVVVGGVPCQAFSTLGAKKGFKDFKNMFPEYFRIIKQTQPKYAVIENVKGLLHANDRQMFKAILWTFSTLGYSAEWQIISAGSLGGVHIRERVFIIAERQDDATHTNTQRWFSFGVRETQERTDQTSQYVCTKHSTEIRKRLNAEFVEKIMGFPPNWTNTFISDDLLPLPKLFTHDELPSELHRAADFDIVPCRKERLCALGNAVVPQCVKVVWNRLYNKMLAQNLIKV